MASTGEDKHGTLVATAHHMGDGPCMAVYNARLPDTWRIMNDSFVMDNVVCNECNCVVCDLCNVVPCIGAIACLHRWCVFC